MIRDTKRGWNGKKRLAGYGKKLITVAVGRWRWAGWLPRGRGQSRWEAGPTCSGQVRPVVGPFPPRAHLQPTVSLPRFLGACAWARARFFYSRHCPWARATLDPPVIGPVFKQDVPLFFLRNRTSRFVLGFAVNFFFWEGFDFNLILIEARTVELL